MDLLFQHLMMLWIKSDKANPRARVLALGEKRENIVKDEWEKNQLFLDIGEEFTIVHKKIKMNKNEETGELQGRLEIS